MKVGSASDALASGRGLLVQVHRGRRQPRVLDPAMRPGIRDLEVGAEVIVVTWLDRAQRDVLLVHPRDDQDCPLRGVFSTRSADRPNPIGLHHVQILEIDDTRIRVRNLEALDGTPIVDIKPLLGPVGER